MIWTPLTDGGTPPPLRVPGSSIPPAFNWPALHLFCHHQHLPDARTSEQTLSLSPSQAHPCPPHPPNHLCSIYSEPEGAQGLQWLQREWGARVCEQIPENRNQGVHPEVSSGTLTQT